MKTIFPCPVQARLCVSFIVARGAKSIVLALAAFCADPAAAGALLMDEGAGEIIVTSTFADANKAYDTRGHLIRTPSYGKFAVLGSKHT